MATAERDRPAVLTFDLAHLRTTRPAHGVWQLVVDGTETSGTSGGSAGPDRHLRW